MPETRDPTETYLDALIAGDGAGQLSSFAGEPVVDDPLGGRVRGSADFARFVRERQAWLVERAAQVEPLRVTRNRQHTVFESLLHLRLPERDIALPVAVVGDLAAEGRVRAIRVYHSLWPLFGAHRVRPPLLARDPGVFSSPQTAIALGRKRRSGC